VDSIALLLSKQSRAVFGPHRSVYSVTPSQSYAELQ
jgi:hypothetical protein